MSTIAGDVAGDNHTRGLWDLIVAAWRSLTGRWRENALRDDPWHRVAVVTTPRGLVTVELRADAPDAADRLAAVLDAIEGRRREQEARDAIADTLGVAAAAYGVTPTWWVPVTVGEAPVRVETWCVEAPTADAAEMAALHEARQVFPDAALTIGTPVRGGATWHATTAPAAAPAPTIVAIEPWTVAEAAQAFTDRGPLPKRLRGEDVLHDYDRDPGRV